MERQSLTHKELSEISECDSFGFAQGWMETARGCTDFARRQYGRRTGHYGSDLTDRQWSLIAPFMPTPLRLGRSRKTQLREVLNALLYVASSGCQ